MSLFGLWGKSDKTKIAPVEDNPVVNTFKESEKPADGEQVVNLSETPEFSVNTQTVSPPLPSPTQLTTGTETSLETFDNNGYIPEPPPIFDENVVLNALGEPTLQSLGLASAYTPNGWVQLILQYFHVNLGLEWHAAIILYAVIMRSLLMPITIKTQRNAVKMRKLGPMITTLRNNLTEAQLSGDQMKVARASYEFADTMKRHKLFGLQTFLPMAQIPIFICTFSAIRQMCNLPVDSMTTGGLLWFTDLTVADPYYALPIFASLSIFMIMKRGIEFGISSSNMTPTGKAIIYAFSFISFPFLCFMPSGLSLYFCTTNLISLFMSVVLNNDTMKKLFKIPILSAHELREIKESQEKQKNFLTGMKDSMKNQKLIREVKERENLREKIFLQAGTKVPQRTFKTNPKEENKN